MTEYWKDINDYEGLYQVSNCGNVKTLNYNHTGKERLLKPWKIKSGYLYVRLYKNGKTKMFQIHRLVAQAFIQNPKNLSCVNHKDENPSNNLVSNLEWCTQEYNTNYGTRNERVSKTMTNGKTSKPVLQYSVDGQFIKEWPSVMEIERQLYYSSGHISKCCNGKLKTSYGYRWSYILKNK